MASVSTSTLTPFQQRVLAALRDGADCTWSVAGKIYSDFEGERSKRPGRCTAAGNALIALVRKQLVDVVGHKNGYNIFRPR